MASANLADLCVSSVVIRADGQGIHVSFPLVNDGLAVVSTIQFGLGFQLNIASLHIDKEVYNLESRVLSYTIG
jgi:hypothetical protein